MNRRGIDFNSHDQTAVSWEDAFDFLSHGTDGPPFVFLKVTEGVTLKDELAPENFSKAKAAGFDVKFYHFYHPNDNWIDQADFLIQTLQAMGVPTEVEIGIDLEWTRTATKPEEWAAHSVQYNCQQLSAFLDKVAQVFPNLVMYVGAEFIREFLQDADFLGKFDLWAVQTGAEPPAPPPMFKNGFKYIQRGTGTVAGIRGEVDLDYTNAV